MKILHTTKVDITVKDFNKKIFTVGSLTEQQGLLFSYFVGQKMGEKLTASV